MGRVERMVQNRRKIDTIEEILIEILCSLSTDYPRLDSREMYGACGRYLQAYCHIRDIFAMKKIDELAQEDEVEKELKM